MNKEVRNNILIASAVAVGFYIVFILMVGMFNATVLMANCQNDKKGIWQGDLLTIGLTGKCVEK